MSLDITLYGKNGEPPATIDVSEQFYKRLIDSDFQEIGKTYNTEITVDEEKNEVQAIDLNKGTITNRQRLIDYLKEEIVKESREMLEALGDSPSKEEYKEKTSALKKFQEILGFLNQSTYCYLVY